VTRDRYGAVHYAKDVDEGSETVCLDFNDQAHLFVFLRCQATFPQTSFGMNSSSFQNVADVESMEMI
jgi:hypothetical protein